MDPEKPTAGSSRSAAGDTVSAEVDDAKRALDMASTGSSSPPKPEEKDDQTGVGLEEAAKVAESASKDHGVNLLLDGINSLDMLALVNGRRGLERNVLPLLYLVLSRHCDIMKLGRIHVLYEEELTDSRKSINVIQSALELRRNELSVRVVPAATPLGSYGACLFRLRDVFKSRLLP